MKQGGVNRLSNHPKFQAPLAKQKSDGPSVSSWGEVGVFRVNRGMNYPHALNLYVCPPEGDVSIEEFETFALERLQVLKAIETAHIRNKSEEEMMAAMKPILQKFLPLDTDLSDSQVKAPELDRQRRKDHISHFILRLAYAKSEDLRNWFVRQEVNLFKLRFTSATISERNTFLTDTAMNIIPISEEEKNQYYDQLQRASWFKNGKSVDTEQFYKVKFEDALDLIATRSVFVKNGFAYVAGQDQIVLLVNEFRNRLSKELQYAAKYLPRMGEDERLLPLLTNMSKQYLGQNQFNQVNVAGKVMADDIDKLSQHFPLCMKHLHTKLKDDKHLRYGGRMQYGLFLKAIGLSLEEALLFWRRSFAKHTDDQFQKQYAYNIRHNYGMEGKRANYTPYSCIKIITSNAPATGDHHGCPFRHFSSDHLRSNLYSAGCSESSVTEMMNLVKNQHYQIACTRYFEVTRDAKLSTMTTSGGKVGGNEVAEDGNKFEVADSITHPNQFFEVSFKVVQRLYGKGKQKSTEVTVKERMPERGNAMEVDR